MNALKSLAVVAGLVLAAVILVAVASGCTAQQVQTYKADVGKAQQTYAATTQATAKAVEVEKEAAAVVAEIPSGAAHDQAEAALAKAEAALAKAQEVEKEAGAVLDSAQQVGVALSGGSPDFSGLAALGTYGSLAGMILTAGFGIYRGVQNSGLLSKLEASQAKVDAHALALVAATGQTDPAAVHALIGAGVIVPPADPAAVPKTAAEPAKAA